MIILRSSQHLRQLRVALSRCLPHSAKIYGTLYFELKGTAGPMDVYVDSWPNFQAVIVQSKERDSPVEAQDMNPVVICHHDGIITDVGGEGQTAGEKPLMPHYSTFSLNPSSLADLLGNVVDWKKPFMLAGINVAFKERVDDLAARRNVCLSWTSLYYRATTNDPVSLRIPNSKSDLQISVLNTSHAELVWNSWRYNDNPESLRLIHDCIEGMPNSCVLDASENPVAWIICHLNGSLGFAFVKPEYRRKGLLFKCMAAILPKFDEDAPIYAHVNEENTSALQLLTKVGFNISNRHRYTGGGYTAPSLHMGATQP